MIKVEALEEDFRLRFGIFLQEKRKAKNLKQMDVANRLGHKTAQYVSNFERGICRPSDEALITLTELYEIQPKEIVKLLVKHHEAKYKALFQM